MTSLIQSIKIGIGYFPILAILFTLPILVFTTVRHKAVNFVRIGLNYILILYFLCLTALVFLPLPSLSQAAGITTYRIQLVPFQFIKDIIRESPLVLSNPGTYLTAIFHRSVLQVVFNILMTVPFGMFLRYYYGFSKKRIITFAFLLSLLIEITQLTGIYGLFNGSYRLCDVDDLMTNTLGGYLGYVIMTRLEGVIPSIQFFDIHTGNTEKVCKKA